MEQIPLRTRDGSVRAYAVVDPEDFAWANKWRWWLTSWGYAGRTVELGQGRRKTLRLHRELLGLTPGDGLEGEHVNGDPLDCRRSNLRITTHAQNMQNRRYGYGSSKRRGVSWSKARGAWQAQVKVAGRNHHLGYFDAEEDAAEAARCFRATHFTHSNEERSVAA